MGFALCYQQLLIFSQIPFALLASNIECFWEFVSQKVAEEEMTLYFCPDLHKTADTDDTVRIIGYALTSAHKFFCDISASAISDIEDRKRRVLLKLQ